MKEQLSEVQERRGGSQELIQHMLKERNQLLTLLLEVSSDSSHKESERLVTDLEEFVQVLVDYIAAGHFGLYDRISEGRERRKAISDLAMEVYPRIEQSTQIALAFEEKYNPDNENRELEHFPQDVSVLGEELATRIELEDQLIQLMLEPKM
ncbi:MAG: Rsd/AlgQ family anti-sigma factor [Proteobacteria bacterium]|nr:Rsd/AlgQ family anti-sigma factor [Pseudomonadota bacterium]NOG60435.1 Rsd/AlgQ family anti-sigma factor [Pseudomonadota bacterium]